jgi:NitT/TauT family transport system permease protein
MTRTLMPADQLADSAKSGLSLPSSTGRVLALQVAGSVLLFGVWELLVRLGVIQGFLFGQPSGIVSSFVMRLGNGSLILDTWLTVYEALIGFVVGTILGASSGLALWYSTAVARIVEPLIVALNSVPKVALAPIVILWFGTGLFSKIALAVSLTSLVALIAAYQAAKDADPDLQSLLFSMGADKHRIFTRVVVPCSLPFIIATFRINIGFALVGAVVGEFITSQHGLGHLIFTASSFYDLNGVWVGIFTLMIVGFMFYFVIDYIERGLLPWKMKTSVQKFQL